MRSYTRITPQIVANVKRYLEDERNFSKVEIAKLTGISENSVSRIAKGEYDQLFAVQQVADSESGGDRNVTEIPFERLERLIKCEIFVEEMFETMILSDKDPDELYFPRRACSSMCNRYFPEKTRKRLEELDTNA